METAIQKLTKAERWLAEAETLDEFKQIHDVAIAAEAYAQAHKLGLESENHARKIKFRAAREIGRLCPPAKHGGKGGGSEVRISDFENLPKKQRLSEFRKLAEIPEQNFIEQLSNFEKHEEKITYKKILQGNKPIIHFSSKSKEWTTPQVIIDKTIQLFGEIDLDPCSNPDFPNIPARQHFKEKEDGLSQDWFGKIYMNPPYGAEIKKWIFHLTEQFEGGNISDAIALVPSRTDTEWFRRLKPYLRCFIWGRLRFGAGENSAPFPSMVVYLGANTEGFVQAFIDIGDIYGLFGKRWISKAI